MNCYFPVGGLATERTHSLERTQLERLKEDLQGKISGELDLNFVEAFAQKMLTPFFLSSTDCLRVSFISSGDWQVLVGLFPLELDVSVGI